MTFSKLRSFPERGSHHAHEAASRDTILMILGHGVLNLKRRGTKVCSI